MINHDPEVYFKSFISWVKEEEIKIEEEKSNLGEVNSNSETEYNEEERKFLKGEVSDQEKKKEIVEQIEVKVSIKKKSWTFLKWLKEQYEWLENKAERIRKEIKNVENSDNNIFARLI